jgi:hypothetical protein
MTPCVLLVDVCCRKNLEDTVPIFARAAGYRNVSLGSVTELLKTEEDIWVLAFGQSHSFSWHSQSCQSTLQQFANISAEVGGMVKVGLVRLSSEEMTQGGSLFSPALLQADQYAPTCSFSAGTFVDIVAACCTHTATWHQATQAHRNQHSTLQV